MSKFAVGFAAVFVFAIVMTGFAGVQLLLPATHAPTAQTSSGASTFNNAQASSPSGPLPQTGGPLAVAAQPTLLQTVLQFFQSQSFALAPAGWFAVGGLWIWRGRMKSRWEQMGFDSGVFELFVRMRGGKTRVRLLNALPTPKDRLQLAQELGLDWKAVDRHMSVLNKYGFIHEQAAYGRVRMYELTSMGNMLLELLKALNAEETVENIQQTPRLEGP